MFKVQPRGEPPAPARRAAERLQRPARAPSPAEACLTRAPRGAPPVLARPQVIGHLIRKEGLVAITGAPKRQAGEDDDGFRNRLLKERRLALSANYVPE